MKKVLYAIWIAVLTIHTSKATTIVISNTEELRIADKKVVAGDTLILKNGIWKNAAIELSCKGLADKPILIKAQEAGKVIFSGKSYLRIGGQYLVLEGVVFENGQAPEGNVWEFREGKEVGSFCRITNCSIKNYSNLKRLDENYWVALYGKSNRIDHCNFYDKKNLGVLMAVILDDDRSRENNHSIDNNLFLGRTPLASNAGEIIRVGVSQHCTFYSNTIIKENVFEQCDGEAEIISIKSCGNIIRDNVFKECQGSLSLRHGNNNTVEGNIFMGNGKLGTGGVRIINEGNWVINNLFYECRGVDFRSPLAIMNGVFNSPAFRYLPVRDAVVANNTFFNCSPINLCEGSDTERTVAPKNVFLLKNLFYNNSDSTLYHIYDQTDSIFCRDNLVSQPIKHSLINGFELRRFNPTMITRTTISTSNTSKNFYDNLKKLATSRLAYGLGDQAGCNRWDLFNKSKAHLYDHKGFTAVKEVNGSNLIKADTLEAFCANEDELFKIVGVITPQVKRIVLTNTTYQLSQPMVIIGNVILTSNLTNKNICITTSANLPAAFIIKNDAKVYFNKLSIEANGVLANAFIISDTSGSSNHYSFTMADCSYTGLSRNSGCKSLFKASRYSVADTIQITNCYFDKNNSDLFLLNDEIDNKGYYNVETMLFENNSFITNTGTLLSLYRGGNDESTMGPKLLFSNNKIKDCQNKIALLQLFGVQYSALYNNAFTTSNANGSIIKYEDKVRATHMQKTNLLTGSGRITGNRYVIEE